MTVPTVSVMINCRNGARYVGEAIESVLAQTYDDWEIVFWDDASTDETAAIVEGFKDDRIRITKSEHKLPLGLARRLNLELCRGKYLGILDHDDLWLPTKLEKQVPILDARPEVGLVYTDSIFFDDAGHKRLLYGRHRPPDGYIFPALLERYFISLETVLVRTHLARAVGSIDERVLIAHDKDLFIRVGQVCDAAYIHEPLAKWRVNEGGLTQQRFGAFATDDDIILSSLRRSDPSLDERYPQEVKAFQMNAVRYRAIGELVHGDQSAARSMLSRLRPVSPMNVALMGLGVLPRAVTRFAFRRYWRWKSVAHVSGRNKRSSTAKPEGRAGK